MSSNESDHECDSNCECDDSDNEAGAMTTMTGKVTEKNPNFRKEDECKCKEGCETVSCQCIKFGTGCNAECGCSTSCQNMFNALDHFFGDEKCSANPCFTKWLVTNKNGMEIKFVDRNSLRERIMKCSRYESKLQKITKKNQFETKTFQLFECIQ